MVVRALALLSVGVPVGADHLNFAARWQCSFEDILPASSRVVLNDQHGVRRADPGALLEQSPSRLENLLEVILDLAYSAAHVECVVVAPPFSPQCRDRVDVGVQRNDLQGQL